jgi:protease-4
MIASATNRIENSETAMIGNIGTIISWYDYTGMLRDMGIEPKAITNEGATLKSTFHLEPNAEQLAFLQESANQHGETFKSFVASRRDVDDEVFRAGWYSGNRALELGLADAIFDTI